MAIKSKEAILAKLGISTLNEMQEKAYDAITSEKEVILLSPTGTGKTLAFLLPIIEQLNLEIQTIQALILVPSRELAIQIEQVIREMGTGFKATAVYGGRSGSKDKIQFKHPPTILIGTPGRIADHIRRKNIETKTISTIVLDEFDKSLEIGFKEEMSEIMNSLNRVKKKILTSATQHIKIPSFVNLRNPNRLDFSSETSSQLELKSVSFVKKDKTLLDLLHHIGKSNGIVFCNFQESILTVSEELAKHRIPHGCFHGGLEQVDRERTLIKFRNGTHNLLVATDLAARGLDVPEMDFIIHYELPHTKAEFIHRNGRSARMNKEGTAFIMKAADKKLPPFIPETSSLTIVPKHQDLSSNWETLYISGGRKDKISKGDIAGLFFKQGKLEKAELGVIELKQDCAFVSVPRKKYGKLVELLNNSRLKKKKVRISRLQ